MTQNNVPVKISFHNTKQSDAIEERIQEKAQKLQKLSDKIESINVTVSTPQHAEDLNSYHIHLKIVVPGKPIAISLTSKDGYANAFLAISKVFKSASRRLRKAKTKRLAKRHVDNKNIDLALI